jgi:mannose-6-phosphate isomerase-like protein (cupin superfamily)
VGKLIRTLDDFDQKFEGFNDPNGTDVKEEKGYTRVLAGPDDVYQELASERFSTKRLQVGYHHFEPGLDHGLHHHEAWEQFYFIVSGKARVWVGDEEEVIGPGGVAYIPAGVLHAFEPVDGPLDLLLAGAVLDE